MSRAVRASDGVQLHYLCWSTGRSPPWAVVVFLHGIASHGGWFAETAADLDDQGVAVYAPDRRGSGRSGGPRGHLLQGEDDATMDVAGTRHWFPRLGVEDKTYRAYPGAGHTLDFEPDRCRYLADPAGWLSARVSPEWSRSTGGGP